MAPRGVGEAARLANGAALGAAGGVGGAEPWRRRSPPYEGDGASRWHRSETRRRRPPRPRGGRHTRATTGSAHAMCREPLHVCQIDSRRIAVRSARTRRATAVRSPSAPYFQIRPPRIAIRRSSANMSRWSWSCMRWLSFMPRRALGSGGRRQNPVEGHLAAVPPVEMGACLCHGSAYALPVKGRRAGGAPLRRRRRDGPLLPPICLRISLRAHT